MKYKYLQKLIKILYRLFLFVLKNYKLIRNVINHTYLLNALFWYINEYILTKKPKDYTIMLVCYS